MLSSRQGRGPSFASDRPRQGFAIPERIWKASASLELDPRIAHGLLRSKPPLSPPLVTTPEAREEIQRAAARL